MWTQKLLELFFRSLIAISVLALLLRYGYDEWNNFKDSRTLLLYFLFLTTHEGFSNLILGFVKQRLHKLFGGSATQPESDPPLSSNS